VIDWNRRPRALPHGSTFSRSISLGCIAVLSDIHFNLKVLQAAVQAADRVGVDAVHCLGDLVAYNADPVACVDLRQPV